MKAILLGMAVLAMCAVGFAASTAPLSAAWNIAPAGRAESNGELVFRMTPSGDGDSIEVTVSIRSGTSEVAVAREIRQALDIRLADHWFNVELGEGANVLVTDQNGEPNFSLELLNSDIANLRVTVQSVEVTAPPTVPQQAVPATPPQQAAPPSNNAPGNALPPANAPPAIEPAPANTRPRGDARPSDPAPANPAPAPAPAVPAPAAAPGGAGASAPPP
jgi:hypothetical protein